MRSSRRHLVPLAIIAVAAVLCAVAESVAGLSTGFVFVAPAFMLLLPLLVGRYIGEDALERFAGNRAAVPPRRRAAPAVARRPRPAGRTARGGRLIAASLAERGPPSAAPVL